jgi:hypothetical protein
MPGPRHKNRRGDVQPKPRKTKKPSAPKSKDLVRETAHGFLLRTFKLEKLG